METTEVQKKENVMLLKPVPQRVVYTEHSRQERLKYLEKNTNKSLSQLKIMRLDSSKLRGNIENLIGSVEIPIGAAGPLLIHCSNSSNQFFAPIATSEGALVSSIQRGCRAINMAGGVTSRLIQHRMVRAPFFDCGTLENCLKLQNWLQTRQGEIQKKIRESSSHAELLTLEFKIIGPCLHVRFVFQTKDAAGQNMTTICTWNVCRWILSEVKKFDDKLVQNFMIDGNLSTDKKASFLSAIKGRGREVIAEAIIPNQIIQRILKSSAKDMARFFVQCQSTGIVTGVHGLNVNAANVIASIFTATGQDIASVHESSIAQLHFELRGDDLYASILLPNLVVGTVGGGSGLAIQKQLLDLMDCSGSGNANQFAEIIAGYVLALELSTGAALAGGQFATAHEKMGRNKSHQWLKKSDLTPTFFNHLLNSTPSNFGSVIEVKSIPLKTSGESLVMDLTSQISQRLCGLWSYEVQFSSLPETKNIFIKAKTSDEELMLATEIMAGVKSPGLGELLREHRSDSPFNMYHIREIEIAKLENKELRAITPQTLGTIINHKRGIYLLAQEFLSDMVLFDSTENRHLWTKNYIGQAIDQISRVHGSYYDNFQEISDQEWICVVDTPQVKRLCDANFELARQLELECYDWFSAADLNFHERNLSTLPQIWEELDDQRKTLIHNDFNTRNLGFRKNREENNNLVVYDWELATIHVPQRDVAEFLSYTLSPNFSSEDLDYWIEFHRQKVCQYSGKTIKLDEWKQGFIISLFDLVLQRFPIYVIAQSFRKVPFLEPSYKTARKMLDILTKGSTL